MLDKTAKIYVAGHHGLVGSAIWNNLMRRGYTNLVGRSHKELDLLDGAAVKAFFDAERPDAVVLAAAHVGGIMANLQYRADFIYQNLQIQQNVIGESFRHGVKKLLFLGSTCIYPREAPQPMKEECLLTSPLEYTNEPYAIAKIAGLKMCESFNLQYGTNYIAVMPTNLYGPNDNFHLENSHVLPAMIRKIHLAKCLNEGDWEAVRKDIGLRPVSMVRDGVKTVVDGGSDEKEILSVLAHYGITPDIMTTAKGLGGGLPIGACLFFEKTEHTLKPGDHGSTFGGNPVCCAGAVSIVSRLTEDFLLEVQGKAEYLRAKLKGFNGVKRVTGLGLMIGLEVEKPAKEIAQNCLKRGLLVLTAHEKVRIVPPLNITKTEMDEGLTILREVLAQ